MGKTENERQFTNIYSLSSLEQKMLNRERGSNSKVSIVPLEELMASIKEEGFLFPHQDAAFVDEVSKFIVEEYAFGPAGADQLKYLWKIFAQLEQNKLFSDDRSNQLLYLRLAKEAIYQDGRDRISNPKERTNTILGMLQVYDSTYYLLSSLEPALRNCGFYGVNRQNYTEFIKRIAPSCQAEVILYSLYLKQLAVGHIDYERDGSLNNRQKAEKILGNADKIVEFMEKTWIDSSSSTEYDNLIKAVFGSTTAGKKGILRANPEEHQKTIGQYPEYCKSPSQRNF